MQLEEIIVSVVAPLVIALLAVYFDRWLSARHDYQQLIRGLKTEITENQEISEHINLL
jgi:3-oxoacyl-ACP reductase-like protein